MLLASCRAGLDEGIGAEPVLQVTGTAVCTTQTGAPGLLLRCCQAAGVSFVLSVYWADMPQIASRTLLLFAFQSIFPSL